MTDRQTNKQTTTFGLLELLSAANKLYPGFNIVAQNCERLDRIAASTSKVKMLAAGCKAFVREDSDEDIGGEEAREEE